MTSNTYKRREQINAHRYDKITEKVKNVPKEVALSVN